MLKWPLLGISGADKGRSPQFSFLVEFPLIHETTHVQLIGSVQSTSGVRWFLVWPYHKPKILVASNLFALHQYSEPEKIAMFKGFNLLIELCQPSSSELNCTQLIQFWALLTVSDELRRLLCFCFVSKIIVRINNFVSLERQMILFNTVHWGQHSLINRFQDLSLFIGQLNWSLKIS